MSAHCRRAPRNKGVGGVSGNLWISASGMETRSWQIAALANDVANTDTAGFKAQLPVSAAVAPLAAYPGGLAGGGAAPGAVLAGGGVVPLSLRVDFSQGPLQHTGRPLDLAIVGNGLFTLRNAAGTTVYSRQGAFLVDAAGHLVDGAGRQLLGLQGKPLTLPAGATAVAVDRTGGVSALVGGHRQTVGQVGLSVPADPQGLTGSGPGVWQAGPASGAVAVLPPGTGAAGHLASGFLEQSNASLTTLLPSLLSAQRAYQMNARAFSVGLQVWNLANQLLA